MQAISKKVDYAQEPRKIAGLRIFFLLKGAQQSKADATQSA